ncbi:MAG: methyltransferase [Saprospiraceae bacterium]
MLLYRLPKRLKPLLYRSIKWYYRKARNITKRGIKLKLLPTVFHPTFYLSTDILLDYVLTLEVAEKSILELGCGNGFISLYLAKFKQANVSASDINPTAIEGIQFNAQQNQVAIQTFTSNLFDDIPAGLVFDFILVNPPFYAEKVTQVDEYAFFAGAELEYFEKCFAQMLLQVKSGSIPLMILSENVPLKRIKTIAQQRNLELLTVHQQQSNNEFFFIYQVQPAN